MYLIRLNAPENKMTLRKIENTFDFQLVGRRGLPGEDGPEGPQGEPGPQGDPGVPGADGLIQSVIAGINITVDNTDPANPIISSEGGGDVESVNGQTGVVVLDTDDISDIGHTNKYVTAAEKTKLANTSGVNTGDQDLSGLVPKTTTVNGHALSSNVTITKSDVGLGNVDNTSDANKPVSSAQQSALDLKQSLSEKDQNSGYPGLDSSGKINPSQLPATAITETFVVNSQASMLALAAQTGDVAVRTDVNRSFILTAEPASTLGNWQELLTPTDAVSSVFSRSGVVTAQNGDYTASQITNVPSGSVAGVTVQLAIDELEAEKQPIDSDLTTIAGISPSDNDIIQRKSGAWTNRTPAQVKTDLSLTKSDVGLSNVDNTSDVNKPVSSAQQTAIDSKVADAINDGTTTIAPSQNAVFDALALKQPLDADLTALAGLSGVQGDIIYRDSSQWQRLPKGTANQLLQINAGATAPEWATISSGGQTLVTHIVAASGGTHTTLGAAIAAASNGDTIWVREGTYSESTITTALTNLSIIGEGREGSIVDLGTTTCTFSGADVTISNIRFNASTGKLVFSGNNLSLNSVDLITSGNAQHLSTTGTNTKINDFYYFDGSTNYTTLAKINIASKHGLVSSSHFALQLQGGSATLPSVLLAADNIAVTGCTFRFRASASSGVHLGTSSGSNYASIAGNTFLGDINNTDYGISLQGTRHSITGNTIIGGRGIITNTVTYTTISGNHINAGGSSGRAIMIGPGSNNTVSGNTILANQYGITVESNSDNNVISGNYIAGSTYGVFIDNSTGDTNSIVGNNFVASGTPVNDTGTATNILSNVGVSQLFEKQFIRMKNTSGSTIAAGAVVTYKAVAAGDEITTTTTASDNLVYGIASASITNNSYGYIQVLGKTTILKANGTADIAVGDYLTTFTVAGIARKASPGTSGTTPGDLAFAIALEAYTTDDSNGVLDALLIKPLRL